MKIIRVTVATTALLLCGTSVLGCPDGEDEHGTRDERNSEEGHEADGGSGYHGETLDWICSNSMAVGVVYVESVAVSDVAVDVAINLVREGVEVKCEVGDTGAVLHFEGQRISALSFHCGEVGEPYLVGDYELQVEVAGFEPAKLDLYLDHQPVDETCVGARAPAVRISSMAYDEQLMGRDAPYSIDLVPVE